MVRFTDTLIVQGGSMCIGEFEVDPILMDITSGEIYIVDWAARNHIMWWCAKNGDSFLDALILAERHLSVSFRQQCMIFWNNHALLPKAYVPLDGVCAASEVAARRVRPATISANVEHGSRRG